jgi:hypothetical protein
MDLFAPYLSQRKNILSGFMWKILKGKCYVNLCSWSIFLPNETQVIQREINVKAIVQI